MPGKPKRFTDKPMLDALYRRLNLRRYVQPDPLIFLYGYPEARDREIVAMISACLAYGKVIRILKSVSAVLEPMRPSPASFLAEASLKTLRTTYIDFTHRFATGAHLSALLFAAGRVIDRYGSLYACFLDGLAPHAGTVRDALVPFAHHLADSTSGMGPGHLMPLPEKGSACKRLNLFLRWMVRKDAVDPGGWDAVSPAKLIVPLDTHMHRIGLEFGFTTRKSANMMTALEITDGFRKLEPDDPVKYDFSLTRLGIRNDIETPKWNRPA